MDDSAIWRRRCQLICCTYRASDEHQSDAYTDIANLVSGYFQVRGCIGDINIVYYVFGGVRQMVG